MEKEKIMEIQKELQNAMGESGEVKFTTMQKVGGIEEAFSIRFNGENQGMVVYVNDCQRMLDSGNTPKEIGEYLAAEADKHRYDYANVMPIDKETFMDNVYIQMINVDVNKELLENTVHDSMDDMAAIVRCKVFDNAEGEGSFLVTKDKLGYFQMTQGEVLEQAYKNTAKQNFEFVGMNKIMQEMLGPEIPDEVIREMTGTDEMMYVLTNQEKINGANALVCPETLRDVYDKLGERYYVLPSSTHEVLIIPESKGIDVNEMKQRVHDVNVRQVAPKDLLSFNVFHYDGIKLSVAEEIAKKSEKKEKIKFVR